MGQRDAHVVVQQGRMPGADTVFLGTIFRCDDVENDIRHLRGDGRAGHQFDIRLVPQGGDSRAGHLGDHIYLPCPDGLNQRVLVVECLEHDLIDLRRVQIVILDRFQVDKLVLCVLN